MEVMAARAEGSSTAPSSLPVLGDAQSSSSCCHPSVVAPRPAIPEIPEHLPVGQAQRDPAPNSLPASQGSFYLAWALASSIFFSFFFLRAPVLLARGAETLPHAPWPQHLAFCTAPPLHRAPKAHFLPLSPDAAPSSHLVSFISLYLAPKFVKIHLIAVFWRLSLCSCSASSQSPPSSWLPPTRWDRRGLFFVIVIFLNLFSSW